MQKEIEISKFLSYVLRHNPMAIGIILDSEGWAKMDELIMGAKAAGYNLSSEMIHAIARNSDKKRFTLSMDGRRIRAAQGHSTPHVDIHFAPAEPPNVLYHGTAQKFLSSILQEGLRPGSRHYVHLSQDPETALEVGKRHGKPVVLQISAMKMHENGAKFYFSENGVWLISSIPKNFISINQS